MPPNINITAPQITAVGRQDIIITKNHTAADGTGNPIEPGEPVNITITAKNTALYPIKLRTVYDILPGGWPSGSASIPIPKYIVLLSG